MVGIMPDVRRETGMREQRDGRGGRAGLKFEFGAFRARGRGVDACESHCEFTKIHSEPLSVCILFAGLWASMSLSSGYWPGMGVALRSKVRGTAISSHVPDLPSSSFPVGVMM